MVAYCNKDINMFKEAIFNSLKDVVGKHNQPKSKANDSVKKIKANTLSIVLVTNLIFQKLLVQKKAALLGATFLLYKPVKY